MTSFYLGKIVSGCLLEINRVGQKDNLSVQACGRQEAQLCRLFTFPKEFRRRRKGSEEGDSPNDINTSRVGIQLKTVLLEREQGKLDR